jgi:hypothetical protein
VCTQSQTGVQSTARQRGVQFLLGDTDLLSNTMSRPDTGPPTAGYLSYTGWFIINTWIKLEEKKVRERQTDTQLCHVSNLREQWSFMSTSLYLSSRDSYFNYPMALECQKIMAWHSYQQMPEEILLQILHDYYSHTKTPVHKLFLYL